MPAGAPRRSWLLVAILAASLFFPVALAQDTVRGGVVGCRGWAPTPAPQPRSGTWPRRLWGVSPASSPAPATQEEQTCDQVRHLPAGEDRCAFAQEHCEADSLVNYIVVYYCHVAGTAWVPFLVVSPPPPA